MPKRRLLVGGPKDQTYVDSDAPELVLDVVFQYSPHPLLRTDPAAPVDPDVPPPILRRARYELASTGEYHFRSFVGVPVFADSGQPFAPHAVDQMLAFVQDLRAQGHTVTMVTVYIETAHALFIDLAPLVDGHEALTFEAMRRGIERGDVEIEGIVLNAGWLTPNLGVVFSYQP